MCRFPIRTTATTPRRSRFHAEDVHDFAWTADPNFKVINETFNGSVGPVKIRLLSYDSHERAMAALHLLRDQYSMKRFDDWYGPYPYAQITVVDPPHGATEAGGMEYPTFITGDSAWYIPTGVHLIDLVTEHEFGHQYWYGMVATNEFENGWLDEGINSYTEVKVLDNMYGRDASVINWLGGQLGEREVQRMQLSGSAGHRSAGAPQLSGHEHREATAPSATARRRACCSRWRRLSAKQTMKNAMHTYFMRYRFTHPTTEDFINTVSEVAGQDLSWYWNQAVYGTQMMDYEVQRADSNRR